MMRTICLTLSLIFFSSLGFAQKTHVKTSKVSEVSYSSARIQGSSSGSGITERGICYSVVPKMDKAEIYIKFGTGSFGGYSLEITDLTPETSYYVRAYIISNGAYYYGKELKFTTIAMPLPEVLTLSCSEITKKNARIQGKVSGSEILECGVCISNVENKEKQGDYFAVGSKGFGNYSLKLNKLKPETTYYARFYAKNNAGTAFGKQICFTTTK